MRSSALVLLLVCLGFVPFASRAATCQHPAAPSADRNPSVFLASFLANADLRDLYPLCGHPKVAVVGAATLLSGPDSYTFDKEGRPLSRDIGGLATDTYMYDEIGQIVEVRTVNHKGDITGRRVFKWSSPYEYTDSTFNEDGTSKWAPAHGVLDVDARTLTIHGRELTVVHKFDANWNQISSEGGPISFVTERDVMGHQQFEWKVTATGGKQPMARYNYEGSDAKGNPTTVAEDFATIQYGVVRWESGAKKAIRVVEYW